MIPVGRPFLDYVLSALADAGFTDVCIVVAPARRQCATRYTDGLGSRRAFASRSPCSARRSVRPTRVLAAEEFAARRAIRRAQRRQLLSGRRIAALRECSTSQRRSRSRAQDCCATARSQPDRIAAYALLDVDGDGYLRRHRREAGRSDVCCATRDAPVSMNVLAFRRRRSSARVATCSRRRAASSSCRTPFDYAVECSARAFARFRPMRQCSTSLIAPTFPRSRRVCAMSRSRCDADRRPAPHDRPDGDGGRAQRGLVRAGNERALRASAQASRRSACGFPAASNFLASILITRADAVCSAPSSEASASSHRHERIITYCVRDALSGETVDGSLDSRTEGIAGHWGNYPLTVARRIGANFAPPLVGANVAFASDLPVAAGISSSSALVVASFLAFSEINQLRERPEYRQAIHDAEDLAEYLGCGRKRPRFQNARW